MIALLGACRDQSHRPPLENVPDIKARDVLAKTIGRSGGWEAWASVDSLSFLKRTLLYDSSGNLESDRTERYSYIMHPEPSLSISWTVGEEIHSVFYKNNQVETQRNNVPLSNDSIFPGYLTAGGLEAPLIPFRLLDPGVSLTYKGIVGLPGRKKVYAVAAAHGAGKSLEYYFELKTCDFTAQQTGDGDYLDLAVNTESVSLGGLRFCAFQTLYRVDGQQNILFKRGEVYYDDFRLR